MKIKIKPESSNANIPYEHLLPIVQYIISEGNETYRPEMFYNTQDSWRCDFKKSINLDSVESNFDFPNSIIINHDNNTIWCKNSWVEIRGRNSKGHK